MRAILSSTYPSKTRKFNSIILNGWNNRVHVMFILLRVLEQLWEGKSLEVTAHGGGDGKKPGQRVCSSALKSCDAFLEPDL